VIRRIHSDELHPTSGSWHRFVDSAIGVAFTTASTLLGVAALGYADQLVELELTAVRSAADRAGSTTVNSSSREPSS
jgi:hypothetical protein